MDAHDHGEPAEPGPQVSGQRPRIWTVFTAVICALVLAVLFQAALGGVLAFIEISRGVRPADLSDVLQDKLTTPAYFMLIMLAGQLGIAVTGVLCARLSPEPFRSRIGWAPAKPSSVVYPIAMLSSIAPLAIGLQAAEAMAKVVPADGSLAAMFHQFTVGTAVAFVILIGVVPGLVEEILFRGYIQQRLLKRWRVVPAILVASLLFTLVHVTPVAMAAALPLGLWFGYLAWRSESILPTILCHFFVNSGLNAWRMVLKFLEPSLMSQTVFYGAALGVGVVCFSVCCWPGFWRPPASVTQSE